MGEQMDTPREAAGGAERKEASGERTFSGIKQEAAKPRLADVLQDNALRAEYEAALEQAKKRWEQEQRAAA